ncbi:MAG TPA: TonB-dependent receptor [Bacteroidales bacterium]|nr:TonB-dependent receptor [Bacteroidales bacterium]MDY0285863.1 TonB-dependent receptor [Bacteroidales bacterium]HPE86091.1 TonB-dependent receptor [Bacteroidales bacterium]
MNTTNLTLMRNFSKIFVMAAAFLLFAAGSFAQMTTSGINGRVTSGEGSLPGATVILLHQPTGTQYATITDDNGYYRIQNMNVGGPYTITITFVGYQTYTTGEIYLTLGQMQKRNVTMYETASQLGEVEIVAQSRGIIDGNRTGAEQVVNAQEISKLPTLNRDIFDFARMTPQANKADGGVLSIAGMNNRYNSIMVDGTVNNDAFGLAANGQNGGQTGGTPFSMDVIEQLQIVLAPYDVRYNGFAGGGINAVTKSGTNDVKGTAYYLFRNQGLAGLTPTDDEEVEREALPESTANTYGVSVGGPLVKNKVFFFLNAEFQRDQTPNPFNFEDYVGDSDRAAITALETYVKDELKYDMGGFENNIDELTSNKIFGRIDWNINKTHKMMVRHSYTENIAYNPSSSGKYSLNFYNNGIYFPSSANTTAIELKSNWNNKSNNLALSYSAVHDDRDPMGDPFPAITIYDGDGTLYFGSETYSTANELIQNIFNVTDNFSLYLGSHTLTAGINFEYQYVYNLFMRKAFGEYRFGSIQDFYAGDWMQYERGYSLLDNIAGDGSAAAAEFNTMQIGVYGQDEWQVNNDFKLTYGLRIDVPMFPDQSLTDAQAADLESTTFATIKEEWGGDSRVNLDNIVFGEMPKAQIMFNPRVGFNWDVLGDKKTQLRGGTGIFTSRLPLVWPGGAYTNNGYTIGGVYYKSAWGTDVVFSPEWDEQYTNADFDQEDPMPSGQIDVFDANFKFPQVWRSNIALDQKLPWNMVGTLEFLYTKTLNNVNYYNLNISPDPDFNLTGADNRPHYSSNKLDSRLTRIIYGTNTNEGYAYNFTAQLQKPFENGITANVAYTFGRSMGINDGTSSQNSSQWRYMETVNGLNSLDLSYSDFDLGHRFLAYVSYRLEYANHLASTFSLVYNGQSGSRYSYVYNDYGDMNGEGENTGNLIYIPKDASEIVLIQKGDVTPEQQWENLNSFISSDPYLDANRGSYSERNAVRSPFENIVDFRFMQDFYLNVGGKKHDLQFTFDIFNFTNLLNKDWGRRYYVAYGTYQLIRFEGMSEDGTTPTFSYSGPESADDIFNIDDSGLTSSRWQGQIGLRYIFN